MTMNYNRNQNGNPFPWWNRPTSQEPSPQDGAAEGRTDSRADTPDAGRSRQTDRYGADSQTAGSGSSREDKAQESDARQEPEQKENGSSRHRDDWQNDPSLKNMDLKKLAFLSELVSQSSGKSLDSLLPFLVAANQNANSMGLQFSDSETDLILKVLKSRMNPEEQSRIELFRKMADLLGNKKP